MTTFAAALKNEIRRLARKEVKALTGTTTQAVARYRREIAMLKRELNQQRKRIAFIESQERKRSETPHEPNAAETGSRFSARSVKAQRRRTGLSAADYAKLVGVSPLTIYNWENSKSRPRRGQLAALVAVRGLGKREALRRLEFLSTNTRNGAPRARRGQRKKK
jgi:DNA-binding transcriptional regulator YiaG